MSNENKHGAILIAAFVANSILNYGFSVMLSWFLNPAEFGMLGVAQSLLLLSGMAVGSGFAWTAAHDIALSGVCEESRQSFRSSWVANTSLGLLLAGAFWVMYTSRFFPFGPNYFLIILFVGLTTVLLAIRSVFTGALRGLFRFGSLSVNLVIEVVVKIGVGLALVVGGFGVPGVLIGFACAVFGFLGPIKGTKKTSGLPVSVDATCSGLQHLSALALDRTAAEMVNVVPTDKPSDGYLIVAEKAKEVLPERLHDHITRKVTKRTVMTTPYGVTLNSARDYIRQELKDVELEQGELQMIVKAIYQYGVRQVCDGPCRSMEFIQKVAGERIKSGATSIDWVTPSGFPVHQEYRCNEVERVRTRLLGERIASYLLKEWEDRQIDLKKAKVAASPNLIHSLDAALLHLVFAEWDRARA